MARKLNQIIAIEKGTKTKATERITELYHAVQKPDLFNGFSRAYQPIKDGGETLPPENKKVQFTVDDVIRSVIRTQSDFLNITASKDYTNCVAKADVVIDGKTIITDAPVPFLLFLEKTVTDLRNVILKLPVLDEAEDWKYDQASSLARTEPIKTHRTKKVQKPLVMYDATPEHPAQTQLITEDETVGYWSQTKLSGALAKSKKTEYLDKVEKLLNAIKEAREAANSTEEVKVDKVADSVFGYLFSDPVTNPS
jgi:hypothetical protein